MDTFAPNFQNIEKRCHMFHGERICWFCDVQCGSVRLSISRNLRVQKCQ